MRATAINAAINPAIIVGIVLGGLGAARAQTNPNCVEPNVLILFDVSGSMAWCPGETATSHSCHWQDVGSRYNIAQQAVVNLTRNTDKKINYGLMLFPQPNEIAYPVHCGPRLPDVLVPIAPISASKIFDLISPTLDGGGTNPKFFGGPRGDYDTPIYQALDSAGYEDALFEDGRRSYIILITDGEQDCGWDPSVWHDYDSEPDRYNSSSTFIPAEYEENRQEINGLVDELTGWGVQTFVVGFGNLSAGAKTTLNLLAASGGTALADCTVDCFYKADDYDHLKGALDSIMQIVGTETCDTIDNDCDSLIDEENDTSIPCSTACGGGYLRCLNGSMQTCDAPPVVTETCDGVDNDCNGTVDDGCACIHGDTRPCGTDTGDCVAGTEHCDHGAWVGCTAVGPESEVCDPAPMNDEDCDGFTNEGCECANGSSRPCGPSEGSCEPGTQTCVAGAWGACIGAIGPQTEVCDAAAQDEDCDGYKNEGCACANGATQPCGLAEGTCVQGTQTCSAGAWGACIGAIGPQTEVCDAGLQDEDCDGTKNEGCECANGATQPCGLAEGTCKQGTQTCAAGKWGACVGAIGPQEESCDALDNDCDGSVDETCDCIHGKTRPCGSDRGECKKGTQLCVSGAWQACEGAIWPRDEVCEGQKDENCDGVVDEGCKCTNGMVQRCGESEGVCKPGSQTCVSGKWDACAGAVFPSDADPCDGLDNDCDGIVDEFCGCISGTERACGSSQGQCEPGYQVCTGGTWSECIDAIGPTPELCDNIDNNCDAEVDNDADCGGGLTCRCGTCVGPCGPDGECSGDARCVEGACIFESCPEGYYCDGQKCAPGEDPDDGGGDGDTDDPSTDKEDLLNGVGQQGCRCASGGEVSALWLLVTALGAALALLRRRNATR